MALDNAHPHVAVRGLDIGISGAAISVKDDVPFLGQEFLHAVVAWQRALDEEWGGKGGYHAHRHNDGVHAIVEHAQSSAQRGDDKREFTYLCEAETALHCYLEWLASGKHACCAKHYHSHYHHHRQ